MKFCIPRVVGRGAGLGNELIPWAKAFIASQELNAHLMYPAWGLNKRGYRKYFETSRIDWLFPMLLQKLLPTYTLTEFEYLESGKLDFADAVRVFEKKYNLNQKSSYVLYLEGMWGGYESLRRSREFLLSELQATKHTQSNLYELCSYFDNTKFTVAVHIRLGDFEAAFNLKNYRGKFNTRIPIEWYSNICRRLQSAFEDKITFLLFSDGSVSDFAEFINEFNPVTTLDQSNSDCSDFLAMVKADLLICSVSSYSMLAAFLSDRPYVWFKPNLQQHDDFLSIWGHELSQSNPKGLTAINLERLKTLDLDESSRGVPMDFDDVLPDFLIDTIIKQLAIKSPATDLIRYGVVRTKCQ
jgi:hypothetical protein